MRLDADAEMLGGTVERFGLAGDLELGDLLGAQDRVVAPAGLRAPADDFQGGPERDDREHLHRFRDKWPADGDALSYLVGLVGVVAISRSLSVDVCRCQLRNDQTACWMNGRNLDQFGLCLTKVERIVLFGTKCKQPIEMHHSREKRRFPSPSPLGLLAR